MILHADTEHREQIYICNDCGTIMCESNVLEVKHRNYKGQMFTDLLCMHCKTKNIKLLIH